jgi:hypothetical protein
LTDIQVAGRRVNRLSAILASIGGVRRATGENMRLTSIRSLANRME